MKHLMLSLVFVGLVNSSLAATPENKSGDADALIASVGPLVEKAKNPKDLDGLLAKLNALAERAHFTQTDPQALLELQRLQAAFAFVTLWQDYLSAKVARDFERTKGSLDKLLHSQQVGDPIFLPRSQILEIQAEADGFAITAGKDPLDPDNILDSAKTAEDVPAVIDKLGSLADKNPAANRGLDWSQLDNFYKQYSSVKAGLPVSLDLNTVFDGPVMGTGVSHLKALLLRYMLPRYFGTEESNPPRSGETIRAYLERLRNSAIAKEDWPMLQKVMGVELRLSFGKPPDIFNDRNGFTGSQCFLAGLSQEAAGQYAMAVKSYEDALKRTDTLIPSKVVGKRLAAIQAAHPDEFEQGLEVFLTPPSNPLDNPGFNMGYRNIFNMPGRPEYVPPSNIFSVLPLTQVVNIPGRQETTKPPANKPVR
jgi:hypothetical protein